MLWSVACYFYIRNIWEVNETGLVWKTGRARQCCVLLWKGNSLINCVKPPRLDLQRSSSAMLCFVRGRQFFILLKYIQDKEQRWDFWIEASKVEIGNDVLCAAFYFYIRNMRKRRDLISLDRQVQVDNIIYSTLYNLSPEKEISWWKSSRLELHILRSEMLCCSVWEICG